MTPAQHVAFTRRLGPLHVMEPLEFNLPEWPEVFVVSNVEENGKPVGLRRAGWGWHSDGEDKAIPNAGSFLYALEVPSEGGDTLFADTYAAFAALPDDVRRVIRTGGRASAGSASTTSTTRTWRRYRRAEGQRAPTCGIRSRASTLARAGPRSTSAGGPARSRGSPRPRAGT